LEILGASQLPEIKKLSADHPIKRTIRAAVIGWSRNNEEPTGSTARARRELSATTISPFNGGEINHRDTDENQ
jgi:hypothetical protein